MRTRRHDETPEEPPDLHWSEWFVAFSRGIMLAAGFLFLACLIVTTTQPWMLPG